MVRASKKDPTLSSSLLLHEVPIAQISPRTVRRRLCDVGLNARRPARKPFISKKNKAKRLEFAKAHINWTIEDWKKILWSDESKFEKVNQRAPLYVRRPINMRYDSKYTKATVKYGSGGIMVWGCFSFAGVGPLFHIQGIMDQLQYRDIMQRIMLPHARQNMPRGWTFQQDNDPKHTANTVKNWFQRNRVRVLEWPAQSPDLNPIENLWDQVDRELAGKKFSSGDELYEALNRAWTNLPNIKLERLVESMPRRCEAVIKSKGGPTKY